MLRVSIFLVLILTLACGSTPEANLLREHKTEAGVEIFEVINWANVETLVVRNLNGPHPLTGEKLEEVRRYLSEATSVNGLICKPKNLALIFEFKDGKSVTGSICNDYINFEERNLEGSFRFLHKVNFHNY